MDTVRFGSGMRALRMRRGWTQDRLATAAGVSRGVVSRIERGRADRVTVRTLSQIGAALEARIDVRLLWHGEGLDRLIDAGHAKLVERTIWLLDLAGWDVAAEATFDIRGQRGAVDVLARHGATASLLVVEVKSVVPDMQATLAILDRKSRLGREIAASRGWTVTSTSSVLVLPDDRTSRRRVAQHAATFRSVLPARTVEVRQWIRRPDRPLGGGILFLPAETQAGGRHRVSAVRSSTRANTGRPAGPPPGDRSPPSHTPVDP